MLIGREEGWLLRITMFRDVTLSLLIAVALVVMVHVVVLAAAYPATMPDPDVWSSTIGP